LKENTSIEDFSLGLYPQEDPVFDLGYFVSNNKSLKVLAIYSDWLCFYQSMAIASAIRNTKLEELYMRGCHFDVGAFELILSANLKLKSLSVWCYNDKHYSALNGLLNNPRAKITSLDVGGTIFGDREVGAISSSSAVQKMKVMILRSESLSIDPLNALLCDSSCIEAISNSNYSLLVMRTFGSAYIYYSILPNSRIPSSQIRDCLQLNKMKWKKTVINLPVSVWPKIISLVGTPHNDGQSGVFRLL
jgi:hypothetical protein